MATRSTIARKNEDGTVTSIYAHWDGYPTGNGRILEEYYKVPQKLDTLLSLGDLSSLGPQIGEKHPFDNPHTWGSEEWKAHQDQFEGWTKFYGRDRGERGVESKTHASVKEWIDTVGEEYNYLFHNGVWYVNDHGEYDNEGRYRFVELAEVLERELEDE